MEINLMLGAFTGICLVLGLLILSAHNKLRGNNEQAWVLLILAAMALSLLLGGTE